MNEIYKLIDTNLIVSKSKFYSHYYPSTIIIQMPNFISIRLNTYLIKIKINT